MTRSVEEGDTCPHCGGTMGFDDVVDCTCHLGHPPCNQCVTNPLVCLKCGWGGDDEEVEARLG